MEDVDPLTCMCMGMDPLTCMCMGMDPSAHTCMGMHGSTNMYTDLSLNHVHLGKGKEKYTKIHLMCIKR